MKRLFIVIVMLYACLNTAISSTFVNSSDSVKKELSAHEILEQRREQFLKNCVKIVQFVSKKRMAEINGDKNKPEYEEYVAIGILATQAILKNKTEEDLSYFTEWEFAATIDYIIISELCHRYDFIKDIYANKDGKRNPYSGLLKLLYIKELYELGLNGDKCKDILEKLSPYYKYIIKNLPKFEEKNIPLMTFISEPLKYSEWSSYNNIDELESCASSIVKTLTKNTWGISNYVVKTTISEGGFLSDKGYKGDYYLLELGDWSINSRWSIFITNERQEKAGYCVLMSNGKIYEEIWDKELGFSYGFVAVPNDTVVEIQQKYEQYKNNQNGNLMDLIDEISNLREK